MYRVSKAEKTPIANIARAHVTYIRPPIKAAGDEIPGFVHPPLFPIPRHLCGNVTSIRTWLRSKILIRKACENTHHDA
jgi:hypothetical protein